MYEIVEGGFRVRLDREPQRLRLRVEESDHFLFDQPLPGEGHVCAGELMYRAKEIDDGVVAALQLAAQRGTGKLPAKARMLATLADETRDRLLGAACILGGIKKPGGLFSRKLPGEDEAKALLEDEGKTKPLGFYTWSDSLRRLFRQDRALQDELPSPQRVREVLRADPDLMRAYEAHLAFEARVANPPAEPDLRTGERLLPAARAPERTLILALYGNSPIPDGFDLMSELVRRVRSGAVDLAPKPDSGFYDHQLAPLPALLSPRRSDRLSFDESWEKRLESLARAAWALARETQIKSLDAVMAGAAPPPPRLVHLHPALRVEPLPEYYALRADSYRFLREAMAEVIGESALDGIARLTPRGESGESVLQSLRETESLFRGARAAALEDLGFAAPPGAAEFARWAAKRPPVGDGRMMVPVFFDVQRRKYKVWALLGWEDAPALIDFVERPRVVSIEKLDRNAGEAQLAWVSGGDSYWTPVVVELYVRKLLDRDQLRALCEKHGDVSAIMADLQS